MKVLSIIASLFKRKTIEIEAKPIETEGSFRGNSLQSQVEFNCKG
jgi:hypothetical protein